LADWQLLEAPVFGFSVKVCGHPEQGNTETSKSFIQRIAMTDATEWKSACSGCNCTVVCARLSGLVHLMTKPGLGGKQLVQTTARIGLSHQPIHKLLKGYRIDGHYAELWETAESANSAFVCRSLIAVTDGLLYAFSSTFKRGAEQDVQEFFDSVHLTQLPE
jgi:hypothetical protein